MVTGSGDLPRDSETHRQWNEALSRKYDFESYHKRSWLPIRWVESRRLREVVSRLQSCGDNDKILEVGCGPGLVLEQVPRGQLHGVDLSEHLVRLACERLGPRARVKVGDAEKLDYADETFDAVFCTEVLEHTLHPGTVVAEGLRVLKPGARLILTVPNEALIDFFKTLVRKLGLGKRLEIAGPDGCRGRSSHEWHLHTLNGRVLADWLRTEGATVEENRGIPFFFLPLHFLVVARKVQPS